MYPSSSSGLASCQCGAQAGSAREQASAAIQTTAIPLDCFCCFLFVAGQAGAGGFPAQRSAGSGLPPRPRPAALPHGWAPGHRAAVARAAGPCVVCPATRVLGLGAAVGFGCLMATQLVALHLLCNLACCPPMALLVGPGWRSIRCHRMPRYLLLRHTFRCPTRCAGLAGRAARQVLR